MDDLSGLDWSKSTGSQAKPPPMNMNPSYPSLRPSPSPFDSGRNTPLQQQSSAASAGLQRQASSSSSTTATTKPSAAAGTDSFSNLMKFGPAKTNANLSLAERQAQLEAERRKKEEEKRRQTEAAFGSGAFWDNLGTRGASTASPASVMSGIAAPPSNGAKNDDDDLFAAFNKDTQVDNASHYPPPPESRKSTPANALDLSDPNAWGSKPSSGGFAAEDDDDPFGLNDMKRSGNTGSALARAPQPADDDDFLGDLGRPVEDIRREQEAARPKPQPKAQPGKPIEGNDSSSDDEPAPARRPAPRREASSGGDDFDRAVAKLVDYGFTPDDARRGITESGAGTNVQAVANWLLDDAHRRAKDKARGRNPDAASGQSERRPNRSPANGGDDLAKTAAAMGNSLFKSANSLWKTSSKKMQQAYADFQQDGDPNQPKWMREAQLEQQQGRRSRQQEVQSTDEALMLESEGPSRSNRPSHRQPQAPRTASQQSRGQPSSRQNSPAPRWQQQSAPPATFDSKAKLNRLAADDDISSYSSPNRRRRQTPQAEPKKPEPEPDLLFGTTETQKSAQTLPERPAQRTPAPQQPQPARRPQPKPSSPAPSRPARQIPSISPDALQASTKHRQAGTAHFKRGDYASAHTSYSSSLTSIPPQHPLVIVLLTNRALTALKTGEPKQAVDDADQAIALIGPGNGQGETVAVRGENGQDETRDMKDLYGKALSRKAEALEQMEKWGDAGGVWQRCVEAGVGGPNAIKGRQRCQAALAPKPKPKPKPAAAKPRPKPSATASLAPAKSSEAVTRLREANEAAAREDDEKFALSESVDARVSAWRDGKRDNLRALLGSMDNVLWANSGWKKVGLHELVAPNKVKINYMKAIAKTHPDKLPQDANTEVRLIAGLVFSTLNESWDKFKADNGL